MATLNLPARSFAPVSAFEVQRGTTWMSRASMASQRSRPSLLKPFGNEAGLPPPMEVGPLLEFGLLALFVLSRAFHPAIIGAAQVVPPGGGKAVAPYAKFTPVVGECIITLILGQSMCLALGGVKQWKQIWDPAAMKVFSAIGFIYAWGDILEVAALASVSGDAYQVLLQTKLIITALMMWAIKGTKQTRLQWLILSAVMTSMSVYMTAGDFKNCSTAAGSAAGGSPGMDTEYLLGIGMVTLKVLVSCFCAVLSDKYLKEYKRDPIYMQQVRLKITWSITVLIFTFFDGETWDFEARSGPLTGWGWGASAVLTSFTAKMWISLYLLGILDSLLKNIGEAMSVVVTFALYTWVFQKNEFNTPTLLMVMSVTLFVVVYIDAKGVTEKAKAHDEEYDES